MNRILGILLGRTKPKSEKPKSNIGLNVSRQGLETVISSILSKLAQDPTPSSYYDQFRDLTESHDKINQLTFVLSILIGALQSSDLSADNLDEVFANTSKTLSDYFRIQAEFFEDILHFIFEIKYVFLYPNYGESLRDYLINHFAKLLSRDNISDEDLSLEMDGIWMNIFYHSFSHMVSQKQFELGRNNLIFAQIGKIKNQRYKDIALIALINFLYEFLFNKNLTRLPTEIEMKETMVVMAYFPSLFYDYCITGKKSSSSLYIFFTLVDLIAKFTNDKTSISKLRQDAINLENMNPSLKPLRQLVHNFVSIGAIDGLQLALEYMKYVNDHNTDINGRQDLEKKIKIWSQQNNRNVSILPEPDASLGSFPNDQIALLESIVSDYKKLFEKKELTSVGLHLKSLLIKVFDALSTADKNIQNYLDLQRFETIIAFFQGFDADIPANLSKASGYILELIRKCATLVSFTKVNQVPEIRSSVDLEEMIIELLCYIDLLITSYTVSFSKYLESFEQPEKMLSRLNFNEQKIFITNTAKFLMFLNVLGLIELPLSMLNEISQIILSIEWDTSSVSDIWIHTVKLKLVELLNKLGKSGVMSAESLDDIKRGIGTYHYYNEDETTKTDSQHVENLAREFQVAIYKIFGAVDLARLSQILSS